MKKGSGMAEFPFFILLETEIIFFLALSKEMIEHILEDSVIPLRVGIGEGSSVCSLWVIWE